MSTLNYNNFYTIFARVQHKTGDLSFYERQIPFINHIF